MEIVLAFYNYHNSLFKMSTLYQNSMICENKVENTIHK